jgi:hypothetical protein
MDRPAPPALVPAPVNTGTEGPALPFAFARDQQVALEGHVLLCGPEATPLGLREARRRAGIPLEPRSLPAEAFEAALARLYQSGAQDTSRVGAEDGWPLTWKVATSRERCATCWKTRPMPR